MIFIISIADGKINIAPNMIEKREIYSDSTSSKLYFSKTLAVSNGVPKK